MLCFCYVDAGIIIMSVFFQHSYLELNPNSLSEHILLSIIKMILFIYLFVYLGWDKHQQLSQQHHLIYADDILW